MSHAKWFLVFRSFGTTLYCLETAVNPLCYNNNFCLAPACVEYVRTCGDMAQESGSQRRTKEILAWTRRKRMIRRDEMIAFLAGKSPPPKAHHHRFVLMA